MRFAYRKIFSGDLVVVPAGSWKEAHALMAARHRYALRTHTPLGALRERYVPAMMVLRPASRRDFKNLLTALHNLVAEAAA